MAAIATATRPKPRLKDLNGLLGLNEGEAGENTQPAALTPSQEQGDTYYTIMPFSMMRDFPGHPFRLYDGERKADMVDSIRDKGVLQPLMVREIDGQFDILSGHNRKYCGIEAGRIEAPVIVKRNLTDEEAWIYVIETNLIQRSFSDMLHSEKAAVLALEHSKLFSQGKRDGIKSELERLANPDDDKENSTSSQVAKKLTSIEKVGNEYGLSKDTIARYLRINKLIDPLKERLDTGELAFMAAVPLSYLKKPEQEQLDKCIGLNSFKVDIKKAELLRSFSEKRKLNEDQIFLILTGEVGRSTAKKRSPAVKIKRDVYSRFFTPEQSAAEVTEYTVSALEFYTAHLNHSKEHETARGGYPVDGGADHDPDADEMEP